MFKVKVIDPIENYVVLVEYGDTYEEALENSQLAAEKDGFVINDLEFKKYFSHIKPSTPS